MAQVALCLRTPRVSSSRVAFAGRAAGGASSGRRPKASALLDSLPASLPAGSRAGRLPRRAVRRRSGPLRRQAELPPPRRARTRSETHLSSLGPGSLGRTPAGPCSPSPLPVPRLAARSPRARRRLDASAHPTARGFGGGGRSWVRCPAANNNNNPGPGPPLGTLTSSAVRRFRPGRPPRASGCPTLLSPAEGGGGLNVSASADGAPGGFLLSQKPRFVARTLATRPKKKKL